MNNINSNNNNLDSSVKNRSNKFQLTCGVMHDGFPVIFVCCIVYL